MTARRGTGRTIRYLTHPQVALVPELRIENWSLNALGLSRTMALARSGALVGTFSVFSSAETKAIETAQPLARVLGCGVTVRARMHENDRSATGYLPPEEFEAVADRFFARPDESVCAWETARQAQQRIVAEVTACVENAPTGDVLIVGHGAVGTLLWCALAGLPISRRHDQPAGGGNWFSFSGMHSGPHAPWAAMETLGA